MNDNKRILEAPLPLDKLQKVGITRESFDALPDRLKEILLSGHITPLMVLHMKADNGKTVEIPMKLQLAFDKDNKLQLLTYQINREVDNRMRLTDKELDRVKSGESVLKEVKVDGKRKQRYVQLDKETNSLMYRDIATVKLDEKLAEMEKVKDIGLGLNQKEAVLLGKPVELNVGDEKVTIGVDLREPQGFKVVNGDMDEWNRLSSESHKARLYDRVVKEEDEVKRQQAIRYDDANDGFIGYVQTDENRWEYKQVVDRLRHEESVRLTEREKTDKKEDKKRGLSL